VSFEGDEPHYDIHQPAAWDFLELSDEWVQLIERADAICFGSLAQRNAQSRQTIQSLVAQASASRIRIFDVNLRAPFYSAEVIEESLELASVLKMNETETPLVLEMLELDLNSRSAGDSQAGADFLRRAAERLLAVYPGLKMVAITRGARGSLLITRDEWDEHGGIPIDIADGIGAGDAFTAALAHYMLRGPSLATLNEAGNRWGSWMASQSGAMPALPEAVRDAIAATIEDAAR
jgi:fructokinase